MVCYTIFASFFSLHDKSLVIEMQNSAHKVQRSNPNILKILLIFKDWLLI